MEHVGGKRDRVVLTVGGTEGAGGTGGGSGK